MHNINIIFFPDFKSHFRLELNTYERLVQNLGPYLHRALGAAKMSPDKQIAITLWCLGNQEVYRLVFIAT